MKTSHLVRIHGRELPIRTTASLEHVRKVEAFVNGKLAEIESSVRNVDKHMVAVLALLNLAESFLALSETDATDKSCDENVQRLIRKLEGFGPR